MRVSGMNIFTTAGAARPERRGAVRVLLALGLAALSVPASGQDPENCLLCHRFRGLSRLDAQTGELRLFFCSAEYYAYREGQHARVACTGCHERSEVATVPHAVRTPVDCTRTCHIQPATGTELRFSHQRVAASLDLSVHAPQRLAELEFETPLLRPGQSTCLYCHDEPVFGLAGGLPEGFLSHSGGTRCDTCHAEELPIEITYFGNHVAARMKPARPIRQLAQVCAVCHSDPQIVAQLDSHDAVASYLHSFHGKASLLGSTETATCVECHSSPTGDQHLMQSPTHADSPTNPANLPDTCRTVACHPGYPPEMSTAAVHLELNPDKFPLEFTVAAFFVLMTAGVLAFFFLLVILELINAAVRRSDREHRRLVRLAEALQEHPAGRHLIARTSMHERVQHWILVVSFTLLVVTGMPIKFADAGWARWLIGYFGTLTVARVTHRVCGVILIAIFLYHIGYLLAQLRRTIRRDRAAGVTQPLWRRIVFSPMMITWQDAREFWQLLLFLLFRRAHRPAFGRFNFMQKFEYWAVFWGVPVMGLSGLALWNMPAVTQQYGGRVINFAYIIHSDEAYLAFTYIAAIHLFSVIFAPAVFPLSMGTVAGQAPPEELAEGHRGQLEALAQRLGIEAPPERVPVTRWERFQARAADVVHRSYSVLMGGAYATVAFLTLRFLTSLLIAREAAPAEIVEIPTRLDAQVFFAGVGAPGAAAPQDAPRGPLAHFHQIPQWYQNDAGNSCATSGCHQPLPHGNRIEVRAFLNMHTTFVDCVVCHAQAPPAAARAQWFALPDRVPGDPPAILRLAGRLEALPAVVPQEQAPTVSDELRGLVEEALAAGGNEQLADWRLRLEVTHPRSRVWQQLVDEMRSNIHMHVHGEYQAKIGLYEAGRRLGIPTAEQDRATQQFVAQSGTLSTARRQELLDVVHAGLAPTGALCTPCHLPDPTLVDPAQLGYPPSRAAALQNSAIVRQVLSIEAGQPFSLPLAPAGEEANP